MNSKAHGRLAAYARIINTVRNTDEQGIERMISEGMQYFQRKPDMFKVYLALLDDFTHERSLYQDLQISYWNPSQHDLRKVQAAVYALVKEDVVQ